MNSLTTRLPTVEEVLGGETQGGVPRPAFSFDAAEAPPARRRSEIKPFWRRFKEWFA